MCARGLGEWKFLSNDGSQSAVFEASGPSAIAAVAGPGRSAVRRHPILPAPHRRPLRQRCFYAGKAQICATS